MKKTIINILIIILFTNSAIAQSKGFVVPDSLKGKSFMELRNAFYNNYKEKEIANIYGKSYLQKGKDINNTDTIAEAYHMLAYLNEDEKIIYFDSIIDLQYNIINKIYPATAFWEKGVVLSDTNTKHALENYLLGIESAKKNNNIYIQNDIEFSIGLLKSLIGENKEALRIFKKCYAFNIEKEYRKKYNHDFLSTLFGLADSYQRNNLLDSASYYNRLGAKDAFKNRNEYYKSYFILNEGANQYMKKNYKIAIDSIKKSIPMLKKDNYNLGIAYFYLGQSFYKLNKKELGVHNLHKMDDLIQKTNFLMPEERIGYETLINYYKEKKDLKKQLYFTERLIEMDSLLKSYHKNLSKDLALKYDIPKLVEDKNVLILKMENNSNKQYYYIYGLLALVLAILSILYVNDKSKRKIKKRFDELMIEIGNPKEINPIKKNEKVVDIDLSKEVIDSILKQLQKFEKNLEFTETGLTQPKLAKKFKTNNSYLSKVVNHYENKNFNSYLNDLRINHALKILKEDKKIRKYTIKAVAEEFGFSNSESFSKAFHKKTGIYPSYFVKQLENNNVLNS